MASNLEEFLRAGTAITPPTSSGSPAYDWFRGAATSTYSSIPELFGVSPLPGAAEFRQDNPWAGFLTQMLGTAVPYVGWYKATTVLPGLKRLGAAVDKIGDLQKAPFTTGMAREAARYAPFEAGRVAASQVVGDEPLGTMATDAAVSLGLGAGLGGMLHGIAAAGTRSPRYKFLPGVDIDAPTPLVLREMRRKLEAGEVPEAEVAGANFAINNLDITARTERAPRNRYVFGTPVDRDLQSLFNTDKPNVTVEKRKFARGDSIDFKTEDAWRGAAKAAGLPDNFTSLGQYFRHITFKPTGGAKAAEEMRRMVTELEGGIIDPVAFQGALERLSSKKYGHRTAKRVNKTLTSMDSIGDNWWMTKEEDGLFVMAKKVRGSADKGDVTDAWVIFKTDKPGAFAQVPDKWSKMVLEKNSWMDAATPPRGLSEVYDAGQGWQDVMPPRDFTEARKPKSIEKLVPKNLRGKSSEFVERLKEGFREYAAPTVHQLKRNPLALHTFQLARVVHDAGQKLGDEILYGLQNVTAKNLFLGALQSKRDFSGTRNIKAAIDSLTDDDVRKLTDIWRNKDADLNTLVQSGQISPALAGAVETLQQLDDKLWNQLVGLLKVLGRKPPRSRSGYLGLPRVWEGDSRIAIRDAAGQVVGIAAGPNRKTAQANARRLVEEIHGGRLAEEFDLSQGRKELPKDLAGLLNAPQYVLEQKNIRGYKFDLDPFTRKDLMDAYEAAIRKKLNHQAALAVEDLAAQPLAKVAAANPADYRILEARLRDLRGEPSEFAKWQNRVADQFLAPIIGTNSASKIVSVTNTMLYTLNLGMGKLSFPILNALTFPQTVISEAAFLMSGVDEFTAGKYSYIAAYGSQGKPVGALGFINPFTLMFSSMRDMARPSGELVEAFGRAVKERVIDPRFVEEFIGESAVKVKDLRRAFGSGEDFVGWLRALNDFLPGNSERMARAHAFTVGYKLAKEYLKIADEDMAYLTAKQFTENTMFLYSTADRPRIFTTPAGSALGLFKTWMFNYMASMAEYSRLASSHPTNINAWAPLLWQTAGTAAMGGFAATPLYWVADGFSKGFADKSLVQSTYDMFEGGWEGDAIMFGLPAVLSGGYISLYSNVQSPASNPIRDANMLFSAASLDRAMYLGQAVGAAFSHWQATGEHPGRSPQVRDQLIRALAPATFQRSMSAWLDEDNITSLGTGYPILTDVTIGERIAYSAGFNPVQLDKAMLVSDELYRSQAKRRARVTQLGRAYAQAMEAKDGDQMELVLRQAMTWGLDPSSVLRSAMTRTMGGLQPQTERAFRPQDVAAFENVLGR